MRNSSTSRHRNQVKQVFPFDFIRKGNNFEWKNLRDHIFVSDDTFQIFSWCPDLVGVILVKPQKIELFLAPKYVWRIFSVCRNWIIKRRKGCTALIFSWPSCVFAGSWKSWSGVKKPKYENVFFPFYTNESFYSWRLLVLVLSCHSVGFLKMGLFSDRGC